MKSYTVGSGLSREHVAAVQGIDISVREGEVLGILGGNGAGKSTLSLMLAGLLEPDRGDVVFRDGPVHELTRDGMLEFRRSVQLVQQDPFSALSPRLRIFESVEEPLKLLRQLSPDERRAEVLAALAALRLPTSASFLTRYPHELSGGQLQRVNLARGLVLRPRVLILDEPVAMLDPSEQAEVLQLLKTAQVRGGMAMVFVSHDLAVLFRVSDCVAVIADGRVVESGDSATVLRDPQHEFTRRLLQTTQTGAVPHRRTDPITAGGIP